MLNVEKIKDWFKEESYVIIYACIITVVILFAFCNDKFMNGRYYDQYVEDFSTIHGQGVLYAEGVIIITEPDAFFILDIGNQKRDYFGIKINLSDVKLVGDEIPMMAVGHSSFGNEADIVIENFNVLDDGYNTYGEFNRDRYLRFIFDAPVGTSFRFDSLDIQHAYFKPDLYIFIIGIFVFFISYLCIAFSRTNMFNNIFYKNNILFALTLQAVILLYFIQSNRLMYALNDDTLKVAMAGGGYGSPSEYLGFNTFHFIYGLLLKELFLHIPIINWVTISYLVIESLSILGIQIIVLRSDCHWLNSKTILFIEIVNIYHFLCLEFFTFTLIAFSSAVLGCIGLYFYWQQNNKIYRNVGFAGIVVACLIRPAVCYAVLIVLGFRSIYNYITRKDKRCICTIVVCFILVQIAIYSNKAIVYNSDIQKEFYTWSKLRVAALDTNQLSWDDNADNLIQEGITKDLYDIIYSARYVDRDIVSEHNLKVIYDLNRKGIHKYNYSFIAYFKQIFSFMNDITEVHSVYKLMFWMILICSFFSYGNYIEKIIWGISPVLVECIYIFLNRDLYRVTMPIYILAVMLLIIDEDGNEENLKYKRGITVNIMALVGVVAWILLISGFNDKWEKYNYAYANQANRVLAYIESNQDKLFLPISSDLYALEVYRPVFEFAGQHGICYLCGNGESYSIPYYNVMSNYKIKDVDRPILEAVDNNCVYIVGTSDIVEANNKYAPIMNYVGEKEKKSIQLCLVEKITDDFSAYMLVSK